MYRLRKTEKRLFELSKHSLRISKQQNRIMIKAANLESFIDWLKANTPIEWIFTFTYGSVKFIAFSTNTFKDLIAYLN